MNLFLLGAVCFLCGLILGNIQGRLFRNQRDKRRAREAQEREKINPGW